MSKLENTVELELEIGDDTYFVDTDFTVEYASEGWSERGKNRIDASINVNTLFATAVYVRDYNGELNFAQLENLLEEATKELRKNPERIRQMVLDHVFEMSYN